MNKVLLLIVFLFAVCHSALCDTIDHWQVYLNRELIGRFNANTEDPQLKITLTETDTLRIRYNSCSGLVRSVLVWCPVGDSVLCWNDGDYYSRHSYRMWMKDPNDYNVFQDHGRGEVEILGRDLIPVLEQTGGALPFYYTNLWWHDRGFREVLLFTIPKEG